LAFLRVEEVTDAPDLLPEGVDGSDGSCAEVGFKLGEGHLDRVEVGTIGRQEQDPGTPGRDGVLGGLALMGRQIIHDHDIAFGEGWGELFFDISLEDRAVHRGVDNKGGGEPVAAQAGDKSLGHPMAEWRLCAKPLALWAAAARTSHLGCRSGLVKKDQPMRLKPHARLAHRGPFFARRFDVGTILLGCQESFF
jgi:hypothetical protein